MRVRIALLCLCASLFAGVAFAAPPTSTAPAAQEVSGAAAPAAPSFLLPEVGGSNGIVWEALTCDFKMDLCASRCGGEVDCLTRCYCAWYRCTGQPYPDWC